MYFFKHLRHHISKQALPRFLQRNYLWEDVVLLDEFVFDLFQPFSRTDTTGGRCGGLPSRGARIFPKKEKPGGGKEKMYALRTYIWVAQKMWMHFSGMRTPMPCKSLRLQRWMFARVPLRFSELRFIYWNEFLNKYMVGKTLVNGEDGLFEDAQMKSLHWSIAEQSIFIIYSAVTLSEKKFQWIQSKE